MFGFITHEVLLQQEEELDHDVFQFLALHVVKPSLTSFMKGVTYAASARFLQVAYTVIIITYLIQKNWKRAVKSALVGTPG